MTLEDMIAGVDAEELDARRAAVEALAPAYRYKQERLAATDSEKLAQEPIRAFFQVHPEERELWDDERGLKAVMRPGGFTPGYDAPAAIKEREASLYRRLEELGCFALDDKAVKNAIAKGWLAKADLEPFSHQIAKSDSLVVDRVAGQ